MYIGWDDDESNDRKCSSYICFSCFSVHLNNNINFKLGIMKEKQLGHYTYLRITKKPLKREFEEKKIKLST